MQDAPGQVKFSEAQLDYIRDHWNFESIEKIRNASKLSDRNIFYAAYALLRLPPKPVLDRGGRGRVYHSLQDIKELRVTGKEGYIRIPRYVTRITGFETKGDHVPVTITETNRSVVVTFSKKGTPPNFLLD